MILEALGLSVGKVLQAGGIGACGAVGYFALGRRMGSDVAHTVHDVFNACGLCNQTKHGPQRWAVKRVSRSATGVRFVLRFPYGKTLADVTKRADAINTGLGVDCAFTRDGSYLVLDVPSHPLPSYVSWSDRILDLTRGTWQVPIGLGVDGVWQMHDFDDRPHLLAAGATRGGKTELLKSILLTLHQSHAPYEVEFVGVDLKPCSLEFRLFFGLWTQLASEPVEFLNVLIEAQKDMRQRAERLAKAGCTNVKQYERMTGQLFRRRFIVVDEYGKSFGSEWEKEIATEVMQLAAMGAGLGVHLILCTQRPDADVVDGKIRANLGSIVCLPVTSSVQSRVVLGHEGAELLPEIPGRAIYQAFGRETVVQIPYISEVKMARLLPRNVPVKPGTVALSRAQARSVDTGAELP